MKLLVAFLFLLPVLGLSAGRNGDELVEVRHGWTCVLLPDLAVLIYHLLLGRPLLLLAQYNDECIPHQTQCYFAIPQVDTSNEDHRHLFHESGKQFPFLFPLLIRARCS